MVGSLAEATEFLDPTGEVRARLFPKRSKRPAQAAPMSDEIAMKRAQAYLAGMPEAISGQNGHNALYAAAAALVHGFALPEADALAVLLAQYNPRCVPPWHDNDVERKVREAATKAHREQRGYLLARGSSGASVDMVELPAGFHLGGTPGASVGHQPTPGGLSVDASDPSGDYHHNDPNLLASKFLKRQQNRQVLFTGNVYAYDGSGKYEKVDSHALDASLREHIGVEYLDHWQGQMLAWDPKKGPSPKVTRVLIKDVKETTEAMKSRLPVMRGTHEWIEEATGRPPAKYLFSVENGILDLGPCIDGQPAMLLKHTDSLFTTNKLPHRYDPLAPSPARFLKLLNDALGDDKGAIRLIQQFLGAMLVRETDPQGFLLLYGESGSGKSTVCGIIEALVGSGACLSSTLQGIAAGNRFALGDALDKSVLFLHEADFNLRGTPEGFINLKRITGGDRIEIERKGKDPISARVDARVVMTANAMPDFHGEFAPLARRAKIVRFNHAPIRPNPKLAEEIIGAEMTSVLNWAIGGLVDLVKASKFAESDRHLETMSKIKLRSAPIRVFVDTCCRIERGSPESKVEKSTLHARYCQWAEESGEDEMSISAFSKALKQQFDFVGDCRPRSGNPDRKSFFTGISLAPDKPDELSVMTG